MKICHVSKVCFRFVVLLGVGALLQSCYVWPSFVVGDSSGYISYDRNTRKLEVIWEKHLEVRDSTKHERDSITCKE